MPRRNKKKATGRGRFGIDEDDQSDSVSVCSSLDDRSVCNGSTYGQQPVDETGAADQFEQKFDLLLDALGDKSGSTRLNSVLSLRSALALHYVPDLVATRYVTLCDALCRLLRKSRSSVELVASAALCRLLCIQLSTVEQLQLVYDELRVVLATAADNASVEAGGRSACCLALAQLTLLLQPEPQQLAQLLALFEKLVAGKTVQSAALHAWSLLLSVLSPQLLQATVLRQLRRVCDLLDSDDVTLRTTAGQSLALMYQLMWQQHDSAFVGSCYDVMCDKLHQLATDSDKSRNRKDRKQQRSVFRDLVKLFEEGEFSVDRVKFGTEVLLIDSWTMRVHYDLFSSLLGSGTNVHLAANVLLRAVFDLGAPLPPCVGAVESAAAAAGGGGGSEAKLRRMYQLHEATRCRQIGRARCRDKRAVVID